jgi:hypothetical protein
MSPDAFLLHEIQKQFRRQKEQAERAWSQVPEARWGERLPSHDGNSLSVQVRHVAGNLHSRWSEVFERDGEKPDRGRDAEFEDAALPPAALQAAWARGWGVALASIEGLLPTDLARTITIRGQPLTLAEGLVRSLDHTAYHVGQMVLLSKYLCGAEWQTLSIARRRAD